MVSLRLTGLSDAALHNYFDFVFLMTVFVVPIVEASAVFLWVIVVQDCFTFIVFYDFQISHRVPAFFYLAPWWFFLFFPKSSLLLTLHTLKIMLSSALKRLCCLSLLCKCIDTSSLLLISFISVGPDISWSILCSPQTTQWLSEL